jgi:electron transfer flavoprotein beta subunit
VSLNILVFAKQVPDTKNITGKAMKEDGTVNRAALPTIFNPEDLNALETALQLRGTYGGKITVVTMGPPAAANLLRQALYMGADEAVLLTDRKFAGADTLATSYALACAARQIGKFDVILCGHQAIDGDTAQVGPQLAEKLNIPQITFIEEIKEVKNGKLTARGIIEGGYEIIEARMPVLLTVLGSANTPRPASARRIMQYKKAVTKSELAARHGDHAYENASLLVDEEKALRAKNLWIHEWSAADVGADPGRIGLAGSPTKVKAIQSVVLTGNKGFVAVPATEAGIAGLVQTLVKEHILS